MLVVLAGLAALACAGESTEMSMTPRAAVDGLLQADRAWASAAANRNVVDAIGDFLAADVWMPAAGVMRVGRDSALASLRANPQNLTARLEWAPIRGGISADGQHGFTFGFMTLVRPDSPSVALKYLAYWVRSPDGWRAVAYKRAFRGPGTVDTTLRAPMLPASLVEVNQNEAELAALADGLGEAERAFSTLAGEIGLGPAFQRNAAPDAMNMGGPGDADFVYGPDAIAASVGAGRDGPSTLTWGPDHVVVASSGDLGVSIGHINIPGENGAPARRVPFFTIWRRESPAAPWRFVAE
jgi:ketosteroid isomerase-like protein